MIKNEEGISYAGKWAKFSDGVLTHDHQPCTNIDDIKDRAKALQSLLEENL